MYPLNQNISQMLLQQSLQPQYQAQQKVPEVSGRPGANEYPLGPDSSVLLLDKTAPIVWLVQTDGAGYKTLTPYDISPHKEVKPEDVYKTLEDRIARLEELVNGKSNTSNATKRKSAESAE